MRYVYVQDAAPLVQLRARLRNTIVELTAAATLKDVDPANLEGISIARPPAAETQQTKPKKKRRKSNSRNFARPSPARKKSNNSSRPWQPPSGPYEQHGLLDKLPQEPGEGNQDEILVHPVGQAEPLQIVKVADVLLGDGSAIRDSLRKQLDNTDVADRLFAWLRPQLATDAQTRHEGNRQGDQRRSRHASNR